MTNIEINHKPIESAKKGMEVCIKITPTPGDTPKLYGRHFDYNDLMVSKVQAWSIIYLDHLENLLFYYFNLLSFYFYF